MKQTETIINTKKIVSKELISKRVVNYKNLILLSLPIVIYLLFIEIFPIVGYEILYQSTKYIGVLDIWLIGVFLPIILLFFHKNKIIKFTLGIIWFCIVGFTFLVVGILNESRNNYVGKLLIDYSQNNIAQIKLEYSNINNYIDYTNKINIKKYQNFIQDLCNQGTYIWNDGSKEDYECKKINTYYSKIKYKHSEKTWILNNLVFLNTKNFVSKYGDILDNKRRFLSIFIDL